MACKSLDAQVVRPQDPELTQLLRRFTLVRITNFKGVDLSKFKFDYDLTFAILFMDPNAEGVYSRFGTQDHRSSAARMSIAGLKKVMREVLAAHAAAEPLAPAAKRPPTTLIDIPAFKTSRMAKSECYHCHFAGNARFLQLRQEGKFTKAALFQYPLPENLGLTLEVDRNNVIKAVAPGSPAQRAGVRAGDVIRGIGSAAVRTSADLQFGLEKIADPGKAQLTLARDGRTRVVSLDLPKGWRRSDVSWRASHGGIPPTVGIWGRPLTEQQKRQRGLRPEGLAILVNFFFRGEQWVKTRGGLHMGDIIIDVDGKKLLTLTTRQFHSRFRIDHEVGQKAVLTVLRGDQRLDLTVLCLDVGGE